MTQRLSVALLVLGAALAVISCGPTGEPVLDMTIIPRTLVNDGSKALIKFVATDAKGQVGKGTIRVKSPIGSLSDGLDLTIDQFGTAEADFSCDYAADPSCVGPTIITASWVSDKQTATNEGRVELGPKTVFDGGTGGGGGGGTEMLDLDSIPCPPMPAAGAKGRMWVFTGTNTTPLIDYPTGNPSMTSGAAGAFDFIEMIGNGMMNGGPAVCYISTAAPTGTPLAAGMQVTTGAVGRSDVYRLQIASTGVDCEATTGNAFRFESISYDSSDLASFQVKFACNPKNSVTKARGCMVYAR